MTPKIREMEFNMHSVVNDALWRRLRAGLVLCAAVTLVACGGEGDPSLAPPPFGGTGTGGDGGGGGTNGSTVSVARLSLVLTNANGAPASSLSNNGLDRLAATVTALDSNNVVVPNAGIAFKVSSDAEVAPGSTTTDAQGKLIASVGIGANRSNRSVTVTATATNSGLSVSTDFLVTGAKLAGTVPPNATPGGTIVATYLLSDSSGNAMVNEVVTLSGGGTQLGTAKTNGSGNATFSVVAPATTGAYTLTATAAGETLDRIVQVRTSSVDPAVGVVTGASVSANPSVVSVNSSSTSYATTVRALFKAAANAPVQNVRVWFTLPDPNNVRGTIGDVGLVYSDATGVASTTYIPGTVSSPTNGVVVLACYSNVDFAIPSTPGVCPPTASDGTPVKQVSATLTVVDQALRLSIGTNELILTDDVLTYKKDFVVVVVDAAGTAKAGVEITPKLDLNAFYKGYYGFDSVAKKWVRASPVGALRLPSCLNEDGNRNGTREVGEDLNGNGELDPAGVSISMVGSSKTDAAGKAIVRIEYPRDRATWIDYVVSVTGRVGGSEGLAVYEGALTGRGNLPAPASAISSDTAPAFVISPYGSALGCDNAN